MKLTEMEAYVAQKAVEVYRRKIQENQSIENFLKTKKYPLGTFVIKNGESHFDGVFGINKESVGKIVGWDFENNYYRVYYSDNNPYVGTREESVMKFIGDIPDQIKKYKVGNVKYISFKL